MPHKLLIISASAGAGHNRAASALERAFHAGPFDGSVRIVDAVEYMSPIFRGAYLPSYFTILTKAPDLWRRVYEQWGRHKPDGLQRRAVAAFDRINAEKLIRLIRDEACTHVLATHFLPAEILAWMRRTGRLAAPLGVVVTDYDAHPIWMNEGTDRYFVAAEPFRASFIEHGAPVDHVIAAGIPIDPVFAAPPGRAEARAELRLDPDLPTVLVVAGGTEPGGMIETVAALTSRGPQGGAQGGPPGGAIQVLAVARRDEKLKQNLEQITVPPGARLIVYGFVDFMHKLMAASDLIVTKPGGLSTTECLALGLPMVLFDPIPGQEEKNSKFFIETGAALAAHSAADIARMVAQLLADGPRLERMSESARAIAHPRSAFTILKTLLSLSA